MTQRDHGGSSAKDHRIILRGDAVAEVTRLKRQDGADLAIFGHGRLAQALLEHGLTDELNLAVHPVMVGSGQVMFREGQKHGPCDVRVCRTRSHFSSSLFNPFRSRCTNPASEANCASDMLGSRKRVNSSWQPLPFPINRMGT